MTNQYSFSVASCVVNKDIEKLSVEIGGAFNATVKEIKVHETFTKMNLKDDIAIMFLNDPPAVRGAKNKKIHIQYPICIYSGWGPINGENATIGSADRHNHGTFASMRIEDSLVCLENNRAEFGEYLSTKNFCATPVAKTSEALGVINGDGFYEKYYDEDKRSFRWKIRGIAFFANVGFSKTESTATTTPYYIYTDVVKYLTWVENLLRT